MVNDRNEIRERYVMGRYTSDCPLSRGNEDFGENVSANDILAGIDRFRSKSKLTEMRDDEAKLFSAQKGRDANG